jgi:hypothetical protein
MASRFDIGSSVRQAWSEQQDPRRWVIAALPAAGLIAGFALAEAGVPRTWAGVVLVTFGLVAAVLMGRRGWPWRVPVAGVVYAAAFALAHPFALIVGTWPAVVIGAIISGAATYEVTPPRAT